MSKGIKIAIAAGLVIILGVIAYFIFRKPKAPVVVIPKIVPGTAGSTNGGGTTVVSPIQTFPLQAGSHGDNVKRLQTALNRIGQDNQISEDGIWGDATRVKLITTVATTLYGVGPSVTEDQLNVIIKMGNEA